MPRDDFGSINLDVNAGRGPESLPVDDDRDFHVLIIGDFKGHREGAVDSPALSFREVDRDNIDDILAAFSPSVDLPVYGRLSLSQLDDFHPDRLLERVPLLRELWQKRQRLKSPRTFQQEAASIQDLLGSVREPERRVTERDIVDLASGSLLDLAVGEAEARLAGRPAAAAPADPLAAIVRDIVAPHVVPKPDAAQEEMLRQMEDAVTAQLRFLLHSPQVQSLEAAWRGLDFLVRGAETGERLKIFILDASAAQFAAGLAEDQDPRASFLLRAMAARRWGVVCCLQTFSLDLASLNQFGKLMLFAAASEVPLIAAADAGLLGCDSFPRSPDADDWEVPADTEAAAMWQALRRLPEALYAGLAAPRFLLRQPYGRNGATVEAFSFEEMSDTPAHEDYLWANPAYACAVLLCRAFTAEGPDFHPDSQRRIDGLPVHIYRDGGELVMQACAEAFLSDRSANRMMQDGVMPLLSARREGSVLLGRFQSVASPPRALAGRWRR